MSNHVCPLGLCRTEDTCPNAPCLDCMRRLGEHMIEEIRILQRQASVAGEKGKPDAQRSLTSLLASLGVIMTGDSRDGVTAAPQP